MDNKRKRKVELLKSEVPKKIQKFTIRRGSALSPENIVEEILNSPQIVDKV